ncbi:MAG TPA: tetratricopeptide repeat protein [Chitinophagaceae bacterium]|nr:tetratricopeptide repeat protein [Chitinophagaceae bacterium]
MRPFFTLLFITACTTSVVAQNDSAMLFLQKAADEKSKGRVMEQYKALDKAYMYNKTNKAVVQELADVLVTLRRYPQAREKYQELEKMGAATAQTYKQLMELSFTTRQFPEAIKYAQMVKKTDPSQKVAYYIGKASYEQESYGDAIKYLTEATAEDAQNPEIPYYIARSYADMSNYKAAIPAFQKAIALKPTDSRWIYEMALIYYGMHDDKSALKYLLEAAEKGYKQDAEYMENLSIAYLNTGDVDKGIGVLKELLQKRPSDAHILEMLADASYNAKKWDDAIGYWDQLLGLDKQNAAALYMIGMSYQKKGDKAKGQALCDKAIQMDPTLAGNKQKMNMPGGL